MKNQGFTQRLDMRVSPEFYKAIDEWRRKQPDIPNRAEAIRRLIQIALKKEKK